MRPPRPARLGVLSHGRRRTDAALRRGVGPRRVAQQPGGEGACLHRPGPRHGHGPAPDELRRDGRPGRIPVALVRGQARQARRAPGRDERPDGRTAPVEHDRQVGDVPGHEARGQVRRDVMLCQQHHRVGVHRGPGGRPRGREARRAERLGDVRARGRVHAVGGPEGDPRDLLRTGERRIHEHQERLELGGRHVERRRETGQRARCDAALHRVQHALLPRSRVRQGHDGAGAELQRALVAPERRERGIESQDRHAAIVLARARGRRRCPQDRLRPCWAPACGRGSHGAGALRRAALRALAVLAAVVR